VGEPLIKTREVAEHISMTLNILELRFIIGAEQVVGHINTKFPEDVMVGGTE
jgi:UTP:GlnB (protein PII) uridylyltransferase